MSTTGDVVSKINPEGLTERLRGKLEALLIQLIYGTLPGALEIALLGTINMFLPIEKFFS